MAAERVQRLKGLTDMLMRLPPSPERDRLVDEVRSRAVDVDTGVTPRAMLPLREPLPPAARRPPAPARRARAVEPAAAVEPSPRPEPVFWSAERLSLDDSPLPQDDHGVAPWTLGLRG